MQSARSSLILVLASLSITGCTEEICDSARLAEALDSALRGETVTLGDCRVSGAFTVPAGVTLEGQGQERSRLVSDGDETVISLEGGARPARLRNLSITSNGRHGIIGRGSGAASIENVTVEATRGFAVGFDRMESVDITGLTLIGPINAANAGDFTDGLPAPEETAIVGLVINRTPEVVLADVSVSGFAQFGALFVESSTAWNGGGATLNLATGLMIEGGTATLRDLVICDSLEADYTLVPAYGAVFTEGAEVVSEDVRVCNVEGVGVFYNSSNGSLVNLVAEGNEQGTVWAQYCERVEVTGNTTITGSGLAGIAFVETVESIVNGASIYGTTRVPLTCGHAGGRLCYPGDGIEIVFPAGRTLLRDVELVENERVGLLVSIEGSDAGSVSTESVVVNGVEEQLGAIGQGGGVSDDWDDGVTRLGVTLLNDEEQEEGLGVLLPKTEDEIPDAANVLSAFE